MAGIYSHQTKLIVICSFIPGEDGTEIYGQEAGEDFSLTKTPLILDTNVSGVVESVIEVTNNDTSAGSEGTVGEKTEEGQTFSFEDSKFGLIEVREGEGEEEMDSDAAKPFECELCKKQFTKIEILKRHIKTHLKDKVCVCSLIFKLTWQPLVFIAGIQMHILYQNIRQKRCSK